MADTPVAEQQFRDTEGQAVPPPADGKTTLTGLPVAAKLTLPARPAVRWTLFPPPVKWGVLTRDRYFSDIVLKPAPVTGKLTVHHPPSTIHRAVLRVITRDVHENEAVAFLNGHEIALPYSSSNDGAALAQDVAIDPSWLAADNKIEFRCRQPDSANGFVVYAAGLLVDR